MPRKTVVSVQVLLDETASPEFQVFVRSGFSSSSVNSRLTVGYYPSQDISVMEGTDLVVMAAGQTSETGAIAATIRQADIPVLVIAEHGNQVIQSAKDAGHPLPSPMRSSRFLQGSRSTKRSRASLPDKIGSWIIDHDREKRLSFSLAYPFVRRPLAQDAIQLTAAQNAGIGVLVFVPGADLPVMTLNQIKMVLQIAAAYGEPLDKDRIKEIIPTIAGCTRVPRHRAQGCRLRTCARLAREGRHGISWHARDW